MKKIVEKYIYYTRDINYSLDVALSNKYLEVIIRCLELKLFNEKDEVLFYKSNKTSSFSLKNLSSRDLMMTSKYLFDRAVSKI